MDYATFILAIFSGNTLLILWKPVIMTIFCRVVLRENVSMGIQKIF